MPCDLQRVSRGFNNLVKINRLLENWYCELELSGYTRGKVLGESQKCAMLRKNVNLVIPRL